MAELKTIKELAKELDCSYEAVRQHVKRYQTQLSDHISYIGKSQYLDEWACNFIKSKRVESPITIQTVERHERIAELEQENKNLLIKIAAQADKLAQQADELREADKALKDVDKLLLTAKADKERADALQAQNGRLSVDNEELKQKVSEAEETAQEASDKLTKAQEYFNLPWLKRVFTKPPEV